MYRLASRGTRTRLRDAGLIGALALIAFAGVLKQPPYPVRDPALFLYVGRELVHDHALYVSVWDDKLPSIYLVNALWFQLFGDRFVRTLTALAAINLVAILMFAQLVRHAGVRAWRAAAVVFAFCLSFVPFEFGYTELYAQALILAAYAAWRAARPAWGGALIALAASFWLPSIALLIPPLACSANAGDRRRLLTGFAGTAAVYLVAFAAACGPRAAEIIGSWTHYAGLHDAFGVVHDLHDVGRSLYSGAIEACIPTLLLAALAFIRRPRTPSEQFALWWSACALAATVNSENFFSHYFFPSLAPLAFTIAVFARPPRRPLTALVQAVLFLAAALALKRSIAAQIAITKESATVAILERRDGEMLARRLGPGTTLLVVNAYDPTFYLAARARSLSRYDIVAPAQHGFMTSVSSANLPSTSERIARTAAFVRHDGIAGSLAPGLEASNRFVEVCHGRGIPWHIYVRIEEASRFRSCAEDVASGYFSGTRAGPARS